MLSAVTKCIGACVCWVLHPQSSLREWKWTRSPTQKTKTKKPTQPVLTLIHPGAFGLGWWSCMLKSSVTMALLIHWVVNMYINGQNKHTSALVWYGNAKSSWSRSSAGQQDAPCKSNAPQWSVHFEWSVASHTDVKLIPLTQAQSPSKHTLPLLLLWRDYDATLDI